MELSRRIGAVVGSCLLAVPTACLDHPLKPVDPHSQTQYSDSLPLSLNKDVDILFVIDNSGSMAQEQATLARNFERFIAELEQDGVDANYRIGVTTTDTGHIDCGTTAPEAGALVLESCLDRPAEFVRGAENHFTAACESICELAGLETTPTAVLLDESPRSRPWIERIAGATNLPEGVSTTQAFECFGPQGVAGCGFESPLEAMRKALVRTSIEDQNSFGFVRPSALLAVVFVTDEEDCSARRGQPFDQIWDPDGDKSLWGPDNLDEPLPGSEVCWNAGVTCEGGPGIYDDCQPADKGVHGEDVEPEHAVLYPVDEYVDVLQKVEDDKRRFDPGMEVLVAVLGGVPSGYSDGDAEIPFQDGTGASAEFQRDHGIGPGCASAAGEAVPPVRLRAFAEAFAVTDAPGEPPTRNLYSVCDDDYSDALEQIANAIGRKLPPACMPVCVADTKPETDELDEQCTVRESWTDIHGKAHDDVLVKCEIVDGVATVPAGAEVCYTVRTDATADGDTHDDLDPKCVADGWNLQFEVERAGAGQRPLGSRVEASCIASTTPELDCPRG